MSIKIFYIIIYLYIITSLKVIELYINYLLIGLVMIYAQFMGSHTSKFPSHFSPPHMKNLTFPYHPAFSVPNRPHTLVVAPYTHTLNIASLFSVRSPIVSCLYFVALKNSRAFFVQVKLFIICLKIYLFSISV